MNCVTAQQLIRSYLDGYLSDRELEDFLNHVQTCPDCFDELEVYYSIYRTLNDVDEKGDYNFRKKLRRRLEGSRAYLRRRNQTKAFKVSMILIAEFALAAACWGLFTLSGGHITLPGFGDYRQEQAVVETDDQSELQTEYQEGVTADE